MEKFRFFEILTLFLILIFNLFLILAFLNKGGISGFSIFENDKIQGPYDFIKNSDITLVDGKLIIDVHDKKIVLSNYIDSESMEPLINKYSTGIGIKISSAEQINVGDIITFRQNGVLIVHRIIEKGFDEKGMYFITKGDNNNFDDGKIRFEQIESVLIGMVY